ncbi:MAG: glycosyltransferase family 2 protein [Chthoniobacterales bacterium]|nr:glycosyltransferase family 2 protein [Chthoniobacterales bacterium]
MRFHCLLPIRDEADIVSQCLRHLLKWADYIYVFDTGSVDNSWEVVQDYAATDQRIIALKKESVYFSETLLRGWMFHHARNKMYDGDWFLRVDADEFHHISPPEFVREHMRKHETVAYHQYYDFRLTESEVDAWAKGEETLADRSQPIENRRRHYTVSVYAEPRLCLYRKTMKWPETVSFPYNAGYVARERLPIRHYPHRDPAQLQKRCLLRAVMMSDEQNRQNWSRPEAHHWSCGNWREFIVSDNEPGLKYWQLGTLLPIVRQTNHLKLSHIRILQRAAHSVLLPLLDSNRSGFSASALPQPIPPAVAEELKKALGSEAVEV